MPDHRATVTLDGDLDLRIEREFAAPPRLVWQAMTDPELVKRWWAGQRGVVTHAEIDLRVGGGWRYVMSAHGGFEVAFHGEYREIEPHRRLVSTEVFEGMPDVAALTTVTLTERDGHTLLVTHVHHSAPEHRTAHVESGMEGGMNEAYDALDALASSLA